VHVVRYGAFAELEPGIEGLIHVSQLSREFVEDPRDVVSIGDVATVRILHIDLDRQRIALSLKDAPQWIEASSDVGMLDEAAAGEALELQGIAVYEEVADEAETADCVLAELVTMPA